jgi:hypothetical protein
VITVPDSASLIQRGVAGSGGRCPRSPRPRGLRAPRGQPILPRLAFPGGRFGGDFLPGRVADESPAGAGLRISPQAKAGRATSEAALKAGRASERTIDMWPACITLVAVTLVFGLEVAFLAR